MGRFVRVLCFTVCLAALSGNESATGQDNSRATLNITVPVDAKLYFNGTLTKQTGTSRTFTTPGLTPGTAYNYDLMAEVVRNGKTLTQKKTVTFKGGDSINVDFSTIDQPGGADGGAATQAPPGDRWPRKVVSDGATITIYQPQIEKWEQNRLEARAAVSIETKASPQPIYGVIWTTGRTEVDKETRQVQLDDVQITKGSFPSAPDKTNEFLTALRKTVPAGTRTLSLNRLEANLAVTRAESQRKQPELKNEPPQIIYSNRPALLVLVDGKPALRQIDGVKLLRIINTRALLVFDQDAGKYYLHVLDRWMEAGALEGPWAISAAPPAALQTVLTGLGNDSQVDLLDDMSADLKEDFEEGTVPTVFVSTTPAELIDTRGEPDLAPIDGTKLLWVKNTTDQLVLNTDDSNYYALLSGRWFRSKSLAKGPWEFVAADKLPADFAKVPETHPRGDVLSSVAGTPQAQEALIANQVPQTATIQRSTAKLTPTYDGAPQFQPVAGTDLQYATNSPTPIVQVSANSYYACENGVWFTAAAPTGPWVAATSVPDAIYAMPPESPIYYVTNVYVYGSTPEYVYTGYTPGYFGTCVCPQSVVVYGTGWNFVPWVGRYWYGRPWTYGWGARFAWTSAGWGFGFATACSRPWWGPVGWHGGWGGTGWNAGWNRGWGGGYANAHINNFNFNNANVYNRWGNNVHVNQNINRNTAINAAHNTQVINNRKDLNNVIAGHDGNVYRRDGQGWASHNGNQWQHVEPAKLPDQQRQQFENTQKQLNQEWSARKQGNVNHDQFQARSPEVHPTPAQRQPAAGNAGFHGNPGGFRGNPGGGRRR